MDQSNTGAALAAGHTELVNRLAQELTEALPAIDFASDVSIEDGIKKLVAEKGLGFGDYQAVARLAVTGTNAGPSLTAIFRVLGREQIVARLMRFLATI